MKHDNNAKAARKYHTIRQQIVRWRSRYDGLHKLFTQGIFYLLFSYSNSQSNYLIFFVTNSLKIVELVTLLVLQDNNKT